MFDTMTVTKVGIGVLSPLLVLLLGGWAAQGLYSTEVSHGDDHIPGYSIEVVSNDAPAEEVIEIPFAEVYETADAGAGEALWRQCSSCHANVAGQNGVGPYLHGVVDRDIASVDGFGYSDALAGLDGDWTPEALSGFLESPRNYAPGTAMAYNGMGDVEDRANLIAYLATFDD
ncbi:MAG: cytochrome c family protein [Pseudomonadota bacterium]